MAKGDFNIFQGISVHSSAGFIKTYVFKVVQAITFTIFKIFVEYRQLSELSVSKKGGPPHLLI